MSTEQPIGAGRIVHAILPSPVNGTDIAPAIVTRSWGGGCVNLTIFPDAGDLIVQTAGSRAASVYVFDTEDEARTHIESTGPNVAAFWPPRV